MSGASSDVRDDKSKEVKGSSNAEEEAKPWKQKKRVPQAATTSADIEIYEGKVVNNGSCDFDVTSPESGYLRIQCKDDGEFAIPFTVVECFECVDVILYGGAIFKEKVEKVIRFPDIRLEVMESVLRFVFIEHLNTVKAAKYWGRDTPRLVFQFEETMKSVEVVAASHCYAWRSRDIVIDANILSMGLESVGFFELLIGLMPQVDPGQVMELIYAAHFLGIRSLLEVAATMVAHHFSDVPDVSSMPTDLAWCVAEKFSARELFDAEQRPDFLSLNLDTDILWEQHCRRFVQEDLVTPVSAVASYPPYDAWGLAGGPPPTSWKSLFIALELQQLADRQDGQTDSFFAEVAYKGRSAYSHTIRVMMWEWVLSAPGSISLALYTSLFPNLLSLTLVKVALCKPSADGTLPCMSLGDILQSLALLQHLDISESGVTPDAAVCLSKGLQSHKRLQVLRMAYNSIQTRGFSAIALSLPPVKTLKFLDVRGNGIASCMAQEAVAAIEDSFFEVLLLEGNFRPLGDPLPRKTNWRSVGHQTPDVTAQREVEEITPTAEFKLQALVWSGFPRNLKRLELQQCAFTDTHITTLMRALSQHFAIQHLDLSDNDITSTGATAVFSWLQSNGSLQDLLLANNNITDSSSLALMAALESHPCLQKLSLCGNYSYGEDNLPAVIRAAVCQGEALLVSQNKRFTLDLALTDIAFATRTWVRREFADTIKELKLLI